MAPTRVLSTQSKPSGTAVPMRKGVTTRNSTMSNQLTKQSGVIRETRLKRKADASPPKDKTVKRSALGNITNVSKVCLNIVCNFYCFIYSYIKFIYLFSLFFRQLEKHFHKVMNQRNLSKSQFLLHNPKQ